MICKMVSYVSFGKTVPMYLNDFECTPKISEVHYCWSHKGVLRLSMR